MRKTNLGGAGFNPQYSDRLFTPFQRLDFGEFTDLFTRMTGYWLDINQSAQQ